jgi:hypothetical protein
MSPSWGHSILEMGLFCSLPEKSPLAARLLDPWRHVTPIPGRARLDCAIEAGRFCSKVAGDRQQHGFHP